MRTTVQDHMTPAPLQLIIAQDGAAQAPALAGEAKPAQTSSGQTADGSGGAAPAATGAPDLMVFLIPVVIFFIFITFMSSRREKKRRQQLQKVAKHDRVRTRGGIIGSVVDASDDQLVIKVDEGRDTRITLDRQYIDAILDGTSNS